jgi:hypothetical protein
MPADDLIVRLRELAGLPIDNVVRAALHEAANALEGVTDPTPPEPPAPPPPEPPADP